MTMKSIYSWSQGRLCNNSQLQFHVKIRTIMAHFHVLMKPRNNNQMMMMEVSLGRAIKL